MGNPAAPTTSYYGKSNKKPIKLGKKKPGMAKAMASTVKRKGKSA